MRGASRSALVLVALGLAVEALYPFTLDPPRWRANEVTRSADGGLRFAAHNVARTPGPPPFVAAMRRGAQLRIELEIRSARREQGGPARILSLSQDYWNAALLVAQSDSDLIVAVNRHTEAAARAQPLRVKGLFAEAGWHRVEVLLDADHIAIAVDGAPRATRVLPEGYARDWSERNRLALGDEPLGNRPWRGEMRVASVALDGRALDYLHGPELEIPSRSFYLPERLRRPRRYLLHDEPGVVGLHLLSFVPLGALAAAGATRRRELAVALRSAAGLALVLQLAKIVFAGRHPCLLDVAAQGTGAAVGAWLVAALRGRRA